MTQPLGFERKRGQTASEVKYFSRGHPTKLFLYRHQSMSCRFWRRVEMTLQGAIASRRYSRRSNAGRHIYLIGDPSQCTERFPFTRAYSATSTRASSLACTVTRTFRIKYDFRGAPGRGPARHPGFSREPNGSHRTAPEMLVLFSSAGKGMQHRRLSQGKDGPAPASRRPLPAPQRRW